MSTLVIWKFKLSSYTNGGFDIKLTDCTVLSKRWRNEFHALVMET